MNYLVVTVGLFLKPINIQHLHTHKKKKKINKKRLKLKVIFE